MRRAILGHGLVCAVIALVAVVVARGTDPLEAASTVTVRLSRPESDSRREPARVLVVHSYHPGYPWVDTITRGVHMVLPETEVELGVHYMDTKRKTSEAWKTEAGLRARRLVEDWRPAVVIAVDDNAQQYFAADLVRSGTVPVVFCGVNGEPEAYGYPAPTVTGVLERPHLDATVRLVQRMIPGVRRIAILSDSSPTSVGALDHMVADPAVCEIVSKEMAESFEDWKAAVLRATDTADALAVYTYHTLSEAGSDESMDPTAVMSWTAANTRIPVLGFLPFAVDDGALCGFSESGAEQGRRAAEQVRRILDGASPGSIPIVTALEGLSMVSLRAARRHRVEVPAGLIEDVDILLGE